jgi:hypothetical protein
MILIITFAGGRALDVFESLGKLQRFHREQSAPMAALVSLGGLSHPSMCRREDRRAHARMFEQGLVDEV